jgi:hypothetical protein
LKATRQLSGAAQQVLNFLDTIEVWRATTMRRAQNMAWWNLGSGLNQRQVLSKRANDLQASSPPQRVSGFALARPPKGQFSIQGAGMPTSVRITSKLQELRSFTPELKPKGTALTQIGSHL